MAYLVMELRLYDGRFHGVPEWPPAPARLFQALLAGAARGAGVPDAVSEALGALERLSPPTIAVPVGQRQRLVSFYVPNNDGGAADLGQDPRNVIRSEKHEAPVILDPDVPLLYLWHLAPADEPSAGAVAELAKHVYQFGRGIDPAFAVARIVCDEEAEALLERHPGPVHRPAGRGPNGLACPCPGSLASLQARHAAFLDRLTPMVVGRKTVTAFRQPPRPLFASIRYEAPPADVLFEIRRDDGRFAALPAARSGALAKALIHAAAKRLIDQLPNLQPQIERYLVGCGANDDDKAKRVRVIPLPTLRMHVDRAIRRVLVEVPGDCPLAAADVAWAFTGLEPHDPETCELWGGRLVRATDMTMAERYLGPAQCWRSETPLALPAPRRRLGRGETKAGTERAAEEVQASRAVRAVLRHAGVTAHATVTRIQREPFAAQGTRAEAFAAGTRFDKHALWHVELTFDAPLRREVAGPLVLGNGRYLGLGLMMPAQGQSPAAIALSIVDGPSPEFLSRQATPIASALRRAVMARARDTLGLSPREGLPGFFCGHAEDGSALRSGSHAHLACAVDAARSRLIVVAPHAFEHRPPTREEKEDHLVTLATALADLRDLRAGAAGRFRLALQPVDDADVLLAPSNAWVSITPYRPTRYPKRTDAEALIARDLLIEAERRGLPRPEVTVMDVVEGPRGGLVARASLVFARAVAGPIVLGRDLHLGGGLFGRET